MTEDKIFNIGGRDFKFKDMTRKERILADHFLSKFMVNENEISVSTSSEEADAFFALILEPVDGKEYSEEIFGEMKESQEVVIIKDFFLDRIDRKLKTNDELLSFGKELSRLWLSSRNSEDTQQSSLKGN